MKQTNNNGTKLTKNSKPGGKITFQGAPKGAVPRTQELCDVIIV
jgi:hypothetical protein